MSKMIPSNISPYCNSPGEKNLFKKFENDPNTKDWIILHSLGISEHPTRREGEIDFLVMIPGEGILCLEVKAGEVSRESGTWIYGRKPNAEKSVVGPFKQASDGMHAIRNRVAKKNPKLGKILFQSGVFFTHIEFRHECPEWHPWQYTGRTQLSRNPVSLCCLNILKNAHQLAKKIPSAKWYNPTKSRPNKSEINEILSIVRGDFEYFVSARLVLEQEEKQIFKYTKEQFSAIDVLEENPRVVFKGPAGTGKTILSIEAATRAINKNKKVLFACYNQLLGKWLAEQMLPFSKKENTNLSVGTFHSFLLKHSDFDPLEEKTSNFWSKKLPERFIELALDEKSNIPSFDYIVIDEAQDLLTEEYIDAMDLILDGGMSAGNWAFFGDFEKQAIYLSKKTEESNERLSILEKRSPGPGFFTVPLRVNCRNSKRIAESVEILCDLTPKYSRTLDRESSHGEVDVDFYSGENEQKELLRKTLKELKEDGFRNNEIVILSPVQSKDSISSKITNRNILPIENISNDQTNKTSFTSVHAFKGLESPAVVVTDLENLKSDQNVSLLYIAMTRAKSKLKLFIHENSRKTYSNILQEHFSK